MEFAIHKDLIGSKRHRLSNGSWTDDISDQLWVVGETTPENDLLMALMLSGTRIEIKPPDSHLKIFRNFTLRKDIPWEMALPKELFETWVQSISDNIFKALKDCDLSYHENIIKNSCKVLNALEPMKIHRKKWNFISEHKINGVNSKVIKSFEPNENGFANPIKYSLVSTISGRLKVTSGPEILRINKELKQIIKSRYKNGKIVQFDYVSLEPRMALIFAGRQVSKDIYSDINSNVFKNEFSRDIVKISTLSVMYGSGAKSLSEKTNLPISVCKSIINQLKEFFGIHSLSRKLVKDYKENGFIKNYFGRAIYPEEATSHKIVNNFIQSSSVDAAMLGFSNVVSLWMGTRAIPIFIIHDNLGIDFPPELYTDENIEKTRIAGGEILGLNSKLLLGSDNI